MARAQDEALNNIVFIDPVDKARLAGLLAASDIGLQCLANIAAFYQGTSPNKFFDYIAAGVPVLCNYPGWIADMIVGEHCGFGVVPDDAEAFADALEIAASDAQMLKKMSENAAALALREFDRKELAARWVAWTLCGQRL